MQVSSKTALLQQEKERLASVKADHVKQHKLNQKQIHDLHSKIRRLEVRSRIYVSSFNDRFFLHAQEETAELKTTLSRSREDFLVRS